ncbi:MAG: hypothetical protein Q4D93_05360 [Porphyromonas sp.]|nr:hypothetical protein [Porphyromonas sp.]
MTINRGSSRVQELRTVWRALSSGRVVMAIALAFLPLRILLAQSGELTRLLEEGRLDQLRDSLTYSTTLSEAQKEHYGRLLAIEEGRPEVVLSWYDGLSNRQKRTFENRLIAARAAATAYDMERAHELLDALEKIKLRDEESIQEREELSTMVAKVERMLTNSRQVLVADTIVGRERDLLKHMQTYTAPLGAVARDSYTTPAGDVRWRVVEGEKLAFEVIHLLGDGSWDEQNAQIVEVRGLGSEGGRLSFPFLLADGSTLYFSYSGPETLGRADLYISRYNRDQHALLVPQQLPLPFNSVADDLLYIPDKDNDLIWLMSDRGERGGQVKLFAIIDSSVAALSDTIQGSARAEIARLAAPTLAPHKGARPAEVRSEREEEGEVFFWLHGTPIRDQKDLPNEEARRIFAQYLSVYTAQQEDLARLAGLRQATRTTPQLNNNEQHRRNILTLEKSVETRAQHLRALTNEVLKAAGQL